jgi:hypothetical protein
MVRYMVSFNWTSFIRSTILKAFEAYGSALVGVTPFEHSVDILCQPCTAKLQSAPRV